MKRTNINTLGIIFLFFFFASALSGTALNLQKTEKRNVESFNKVGLAVNADLYLKQGMTTEVVIEANDEILNKLRTEVKNGKLQIGFDSWRFSNHPRFKIYITMPEINGLSISGSGDIIAESAIKTDEISLKISGSGEINIDDLSANRVISGISGSGGINLDGTKQKSIELSISGSGGPFDMVRHVGDRGGLPRNPADQLLWFQ